MGATGMGEAVALDSKEGPRNPAGARVMLVATLVSGCATAPAVTRPAASIPVPYAATGLERVIGQPAAALTGLFGQPQADLREGTATTLPFGGPICVLDAYLYPKGAGVPVVTYLDAREPDGSPIDRASCVAALTHRERAR